MFKQYLQVTKPGIIFGNLISGLGIPAGPKGSIDFPRLSTRWLKALVVASGRGLTNHIDRGYRQKDGKDEERQPVKGLISLRCSRYATLLGFAGFYAAAGFMLNRWPLGRGVGSVVYVRRLRNVP